MTPIPSFLDNHASHSRDKIWPWKFKVKAKVQSTPVSAASCWLISRVFHIRASYRLPSLLFHDNRASHSWDKNWPWKFKVKDQGLRNPNQCSVQLTHFLNFSHQGIISTTVPFVPWQSRIAFPTYNLILKIQGQRSRSNIKVKGTLVSRASSWLISFFVPHQLDQPFIRYGKYNVRLQKTDSKFYAKKSLKKSGKISPKFNQMESMVREIYLPCFVAIR